jgi:phosphoribosylformimino-5-aminoimidazole carboxamide ribotide isomerase
MIILPAIDLKDGKCVRLRQGLKDQATIYSRNPVDMARQWESQGAQYLHVVDLDGAFDGTPRHADVIRRIAASIDIPIELGGGIRTDNDIRTMLHCGAQRVIVGTRAFADPAALKRLVDEFGSRLAVGIDARNGFVQVKGWIETTAMTALSLATHVNDAGISTLIYTDTSTDGMLQGHNTPVTAEMCARVTCNVIASGGVSAVDDVRALAALGRRNLTGVVVGKALYDGLVTLRELKDAAATPPVP